MNTKAQIATGATILGLAGLGGVALSANHQQAADVSAAKPLVRTKVVHRTIHVTKHAKPKHPGIGGTPPGASSNSYASGPENASGSENASGPEITTSSSGASTAAPVEGTEYAPVTTSTSGAAAAPAESGTEATPVTTATSGAGGGAGGGGGESEGSEGGGEHDD